MRFSQISAIRFVLGMAVLGSGVLLLSSFGSPQILQAANPPAGGFGILGDSNSDEYRADDNRGGEYAATTLNWVEILVKKRGLDFGPWGTWGEPRRTGYEYNWARSAATAESLISSGQHTGLAQQVSAGKVSYVLVWIGANDFDTWNGTYEEIYNGTLTDANLQAKIDGIVANITTAIDTVLSAGPVQMVVATIADKGVSPEVLATFPDPAKRQRVTTAIDKVNAKIQELAHARGIGLADVSQITTALLARLDKSGNLNVGGEAIKFTGKSDEPHFMRLNDSVGHGGTVASGLIANAVFIEPFNRYYKLNIKPLSDEEILESAGIAGGTAGQSPAALPGCLGGLAGLALWVTFLIWKK